MILDTFSKINDSTILWNFASHLQFQNKFVYHTKQGKKDKEQLFVSFLFHLNTSCNAPKQEQKLQMSFLFPQMVQMNDSRNYFSWPRLTALKKTKRETNTKTHSNIPVDSCYES